MSGAISPLLNTSSWSGAQLKTENNTTFFSGLIHQQIHLAVCLIRISISGFIQHSFKGLELC